MNAMVGGLSMSRWTAVAIMSGLAMLGGGCTDRNTDADGRPTAHIHVIGSATNSNIFQALEEPFWTQQLPEASDGRISVDIRSIQETGLKSPQIARLLGAGALDAAYGDFASVAGDVRELDLAGVFTDLETMHKAADAYKPVIDRIFNQHGVKLLGLFPFPEFAFFCAGDVRSLEDLKGRKVRVTVESMADFIQQVGGVPVAIPFPDVVPALQTGVVDCAITGTYTGNKAGWGEVTDSLFTLPIGTGVSFYGYSTRNWLELDPTLRALVEAEFARFENAAWDLTKKQTRMGINCSTGQDECIGGRPGHMALSPPSDPDVARARRIAQDVVIPSWARRCGRRCVTDWNATVGLVVGIQIPPGD
jgi:TRAP-type C4-dicarboxylate transport system substrate-binding protein